MVTGFLLFVWLWRTILGEFIPHGHLSIQNFQNFNYSLLPFSGLSHPDGPTAFTIIKEGDYCDTANIISKPNSFGAIINHGHCSIYTEAQNLIKVGYKYAFITGFDVHAWQEDEPSLDIFVAVIPIDIHNIYIEDLMISISPRYADKRILDCHLRLRYLLDHKMFSTFYSIARSCISLSITQNKAENRSHDLVELKTSASLAQMLWDHDLFEEGRLLLRWVSFSLRGLGKNHDSDIKSFGIIFREIVTLLFTFGEWDVASNLLVNQIIYLCSPSQTQHEICSNHCDFLFLLSMGTLAEKFSYIPEAIRGEVNEKDWAIDFPKQPEEIKFSSPLLICFNHYKSLVDNKMNIDDINTQIVKEISLYLQHPSFWLSASEFIYVGKKYGVLNVIAFILHSNVEKVSNLKEKSLTWYIDEFSNFMLSQYECQNLTQSPRLTSHPIRPNTYKTLRSEFVPHLSLSQLKRQILQGRNREKNSEVLLSTLHRHLHRDMIEIHTRLAIYWDEYGSFLASQRHTVRKLFLLSSQHLVSQSSCLNLQNIYQMGCLYERLLVATPMIFSLPDEFSQYRAHQIASLRDISNIVLNHSSNMGYSSMSGILDHREVLAFEKSITLTPSGMMIGYQYEYQEFGEKALPPASTVVSSTAEVLRISHSIDRSCVFEGAIQSHDLIPTRRLTKTPSTTIITVAFISRFFFEHSVGRLIEGVIVHLNPKKFKVIVFCICCLVDADDSIQNRIKAAPGISWVDLPKNSTEPSFQCAARMASHLDKLLDVITTIKTFKIDILVYPEIGMDSLTINIASIRIAPVQVVYWGHPISQQLPTIDYFISSELFDIHNPKCQYPRYGYEKCPFGFTTSEQVVYLRGLTTVFTSLNLPSSPNNVPNPFRKYFTLLPQNIRDHGHIYLLPHTIMKYSTAFIRTLANLLFRDKNGILIILYSPNQYLWYQKLQQSIGLHVKKLYCQLPLPNEKSIFLFPEHKDSFFQYETDDFVSPACHQPSCGLCCDCQDSSNLELEFKRIVLVPKVQRDAYLSMISFGMYENRSVILDPFPFGMGVTAIESFLLGTPVITLPSHQSTPTLTYGMIRRMRLDQNYSMVARTVNEYLEFAIRVATTGKPRSELLELLKSRAHLLLDDFSTIHDWELFFQNV